VRIVRDLALVLAVLASLPIILSKPFFGILVWTWLGLMNPHKLAWSFAAGQPFAQVVGATILVSLFLSPKDARSPPLTAITVTLGLFWAWMALTTVFALNLDHSFERFTNVSKILLMTYITMALLTSRIRILSLVWVMTLSLGFYGVKGGVFTLTSGGGQHVWGPAGTFIGGNNEIGLALNMTVPLLRYLQLTTQDSRVRIALGGAIGLTVLAILGTQSRGALVGLVVMGLWLILKSRRRGPLLVMLGVLVVPAVLFMPETWYQRMDTIAEAEEDRSAQGRFNAWWAAWYLAQDRPLGAGMGALTSPWIMLSYAPTPGLYADAHSIYFQILADHGFVGLALYLTLGLMTLAAIRSIVKQTKKDARLFWMRDLASMIYVSLAAYAASGAFLGLAYFDFLYLLVAIVAVLQVLLAKYQAEGIPEEPVGGASVASGPDAGAAARSTGARKPRLSDKAKAWFDSL